MAEKLKRCSRCKKKKPVSQFYVRRGMYRSKDGLRHECKLCGREAWDKWRARVGRGGYKNPPEDPRKRKNRNLLRNHGITLAQYEEMERAQHHRCAICRKGKTQLCVDHDHVTGRVRGLLCHQCNRAIGLLKDNPRNFFRATKYLLEGKDE